jgi:Flp pilus assembly protein TadD
MIWKSACLVGGAFLILRVALLAQGVNPPVPVRAPERQVDIGAAEAPLSDTQRQDLDAAIRKHSYAAEKAVIDRSLIEHPDSFPLLVMWGRIAYLENQLKDCDAALEHADKITPLSDADRLTLALAQDFAGKSVESRMQLSKLIERNPSNPDYSYMLGRLEERVGDFKQASQALMRAISIDPRTVHAYVDLAFCLQSLGQDDEARKVMEVGAAVNRTVPHPTADLPILQGQELARTGDHAAAEPHFREGVRLDPNSPRAHYEFGMNLVHLQRNEEAEKELRRTIELDAQFTPAYYNLARLLHSLGRQKEADQLLATFDNLSARESKRIVQK